MGCISKIKNSWKNRKKRVVSWVLLVCLTAGSVSSLFSSEVSADVSSNNRVNTFIKLAAGKQINGADLSEANLSEQDLRFLGIYISNFYVPFGTELGIVEQKSITTKNREDIIKALQTSLKFSDALAESLTDTLMGLSRASSKELSFYVSKEYGKGLKKANGVTGNYHNYQRTMMGRSDDVLMSYKTTGTGDDVIKGIIDGNYSYGYWAYTKGDIITPVSDFSLTDTDYTASQLAFLKCLESVEVEKGYGWNIFDFTKDQAKNDGAFKKLSDSMSNSDAYLSSYLGSMMRVDCFGNIIVMGGNHQFVATPGCMNPYAWVSVDSAGNDNRKPGEVYQMVNLASMSQSDAGQLFDSGSIATVEDASGSTSGGGTAQLVSYTFNGQMGKNESWYTNWFKDGGASFTNSDMQKALIYIFDYCGGSSVGKGDFSIKEEDGALKMSGRADILSNINFNKATKAYLEDPARNAEKARKMKEAQDVLSTTYGIKRSTVGGKVGLHSNIKSVAEKAKSVASSGGSDDSEGGVINTRVKSMVTNLEKLQTNLSTTKYSPNAQYGAYSYRLIRGDAESQLGRVVLGLTPDSGARDMVIKATKGFKEANPGDTTYLMTATDVNSSEEAEDGFGSGTVSIETAGPRNGVFSGDRRVEVVDSFVFIDSLGAFGFDDGGQDVEFNALNIANYVDPQGTSSGTLSSWAGSADNGFTSIYKNIKDGSMAIPTSNVEDTALVGLYTTYLFASMYKDDPASREATVGALGYRTNNDNLPEIPDKPLSLSGAALADLQLSSIRDWLYYLLHPTEGLDYFRILITNKFNSFLLGWHNSMVGTEGVGQVTGTTKYRNTTGYVTTPDLSEISWTSGLITSYNNAIPFIIIAMLVTMLFTYILGILSLQKSFFGFLLFSVCLFLPVTLINGVVETSNKFSTSMYGEKFSYWALVQHESYSTEIDKASSGDSYSNYLRTIYSENATVNKNQGSESVVLKWQAPKKMSSLMLTSGDNKTLEGLNSSSLLPKMLNNAYSGENFLDDGDSNYLYRSYLDVANFSRYIYRGLSTGVRPSNKAIDNETTENWNEGLKNSIVNMPKTYEEDRNKGYVNKNGDGSANMASSIRLTVPLSSKIYNDALISKGGIGELTSDNYVGINQDLFNFSIPMFNKTDSALNLKDSLITSGKTNKEELTALVNSYTAEDYSGLASYGLYSENVFYYFSWLLYESGLTPETASKTGYKNLILGKDNAGFFYNVDGNGEQKDFMDMKSLFTYIVPYLRQGNDIVREWDNTYGVFLYDGVPVEEGHENDTDIKNDPELKQKYWHNLNVSRLYEIYTPWVDVMYDCGYAKEEKISFLGQKYIVKDPLDPSSYPDFRPMVFSKSEMLDSGLKENQLTRAERLILKCNSGIEDRMFELLNYHNFNDVTLNTAAGMNAAFVFNTTFSESGLLTKNHNIYPQSFELNDFSYDAFLRFILATSTGDNIMGPEDANSSSGRGDFYQNLVSNSSMTTIVVMLILDTLSVYVVPGFRIFFLIAVFILSLLIIMTTAFRVDTEQKFIPKLLKGLVKPMFFFLFANVAMSWVVSLFMSSGNTQVTGASASTISLGDPVTVMLAMIVINIAFLVVCFNVLRGVLRDIKKDGKMALGFIGGVYGAITGALAGSALGKLASGASGKGGEGSGKGKESDSSEGTGVKSGRAKKRAQEKDAEEFSDRSGSNSEKHINESKHKPVGNLSNKSEDLDKGKSEEKKEEIDNKSKSGLRRVLNRNSNKVKDSDSYNSKSSKFKNKEE